MTNNPDLLKKLAHIRNFGISGFDSFSELGLNGKNSEFHAAMGLSNLKYINDIIEKRKLLTEYYLNNLKGLKAFTPNWHNNATKNFAYFPVILESEELLFKIKSKLDSAEIFTRRYFYPSLASALPYLSPIQMQVTDDIAKRVLCLPLYFDLTLEEVNLICRTILRTQNND